MGNQNSRGAVTHPPPNWTQSFPRENKRLRKYGATTDTKVLPQRIPGQRLRPTENGLHLQAKGTITGKRMSEFQVPHHPAFPPPLALHQPHSASMTALYHPQYPDERTSSMHELRFGRPPSKSYASEPDLRGSSPSTAVQPPPHTIISQSPTKGRIKSKKKYKAPPVPQPGGNESHSLPRPAERSHSGGSMVPQHPQHQWPTPWGVHFAEQSNPSELKKTKTRKLGLFRKKNESRRSSQEEQWSSGEEQGRDRAVSEDRHVIVSPVRYSPRDELRERARSLDCLQHELRHPPMSPVPASATSLTHLSQPNEPRRWATLERESRRASTQEMDPKRSSTIERESRRSNRDCKKNNIVEKEKDMQKSHRRMSTLERKVEERKHAQEVRDNSTPSSSSRICRLDSYKDNSSHRRSSSSGSHHDLIPEEKEKHNNEWNKPVSKHVNSGISASGRDINNEWEKAETQITPHKKMSASLQAELIQTVKNLNKKSSAEEPKPDILTRKNRGSEKRIMKSSSRPSSQSEVTTEQGDAQPKTFFFGMEPRLSRDSHGEANSDLHKIKNREEVTKVRNQEEVHISGLTVEYTRRTLERGDKTRSRSRTTVKESKRTNEVPKEPEVYAADKRDEIHKLSKDVEEFAVAIERHKLSHNDGESGGSGSSRREDGGYHSRQNSGSLYLDNEQDARDESELSMNLRPTLPRRQLEIPRFSPNAAWRSLSLERASREAETLDETRSSEGPDSVFEARIQRYTRPTAPPRGSAEKSADSGISGDAGSPGPNHEFEPLIPTEKSKSSSGPLAVSSPVASGRIQGHRAWTPAQDLDDNSLDSNGDQTILPTGLSTPPKLTSRSNMFSKSKDASPEPEDEIDSPIEMETVSELKPSDKKDHWSRRKKRNGTESIPQKFNSLRKLKRSMSGAIPGLGYKNQVAEDYDRSRTPDEPRAQTQDDSNWRDNWSMSRSIPTSLNTCEEQDTASNLSSSRNYRSRSESRLIVGGGDIPPEELRSRTPSYLQYGNSGHIMYLPEYNSRRMSRGEEDSEEESERHHRRVGQHHAILRTPENERKPPSGDENPASPDTCHGPTSLPPSLLLFGRGPVSSRKMKGKKFSYQSTIRILEKMKLEEKLSREVAEKEKHRIKEMEAMIKVEEEFQRKREREKKKVKQQLMLFQKHQQQKQQKHHQKSQPHAGRDSHNTSYSSDDHPPSSFSSEQQEVSSQTSSQAPPLPKSPPPEVFSPYTSLPPELPSETSPGFMSGLKSWVRSRKESRSSTSSATLTSAPRQEPDGAPASSPRKISDNFSSTGTTSPGKSSDDNEHQKKNIRDEIIAASRKRSGDYSAMHNIQGNEKPNQSRKSIYNHLREVAQEESQRSQSHQQDSSYYNRRHKQPSRDNLRRSQSPEGRRQGSSLMQELSELHQERREYREYRSPSRHSHSPPIRTTTSPPAPVIPNKKASNYRRDFCRGNAQVIGHNVVSVKANRSDESDRHSKHSNEEKRSVCSSGGMGRSASLDLLDEPSPRPPTRHARRAPHPPDASLSHNYARMSPPVDSSPARFAHSILTPFNPVKGYRPVSFSPPPPTKILHVN